MNVKRLYHEVLITSLILSFLDSLLTAIAAFSIAYFAVYFYRVTYLAAIIVGTVFFVRSMYRKIKQNKIMILEKKYPDLRERLRTSFDYQDRSNDVLNELHSEIISFMKKVDVQAFLNSMTLVVRVLIICAMLFTTLFFSSQGWDIIAVKNRVINSGVYQRTTDFAKDLFDESRDEVKNRPLLDNPSLISSGNKELNISVETYNTELNVKEIEEPEKNDYGGSYPKEIGGAAQEVFDEQIPEEHKEVIKEYFKKINR